MYICVCECLLQNNIAGVPSSRAIFVFPQYCASTCARSGCTRHASCVDSKQKKKKWDLTEVSEQSWYKVLTYELVNPTLKISLL